MQKRWLVWAVAIVGAASSGARAFDSIKTTAGVKAGHVVAMTPEKVDLQGTGDLVQEYPVNTILTIFYEDEPAELKTAKDAVVLHRYSDAFSALDRLKEEPDRAEIKQDIAYYTALCSAKMALGGNGKIADAGRMMKAFVDAHPQSYHYFEASETVGDLLVALGQFGPAAEYYQRLAKAPWKDYKMRAGVAMGRALLAQGKTDEAVAAFDKVLAVSAEGELADEQRVLATLGKAAAAVASKNFDQAISMASEVLKKTDADNAPIQARAYNILGTAHRQTGRNKEALLDFLHVDVLYSSVPEAHAEALFNLADLWQQLRKVERAERARRLLEDQYKDSPWAQKKAG